MQAEKIREKNMDRLKLLQEYERGARMKEEQTYIKYSEEKEEEV